MNRQAGRKEGKMVCTNITLVLLKPLNHQFLGCFPSELDGLWRYIINTKGKNPKMEVTQRLFCDRLRLCAFLEGSMGTGVGT
ncbi:hypothetical protein L6452_14777 [Arctium lappa]|uniref:Uncharacterized protein n=1 Tax=Arctium lappa TaxID=4217 RepID=A0ACB9CM10_ARCLA|nr:hypothetical protein L6452_14777 [Arctium lappa]